MFASLIELPIVLAAHPYHASEALIGVAYLANGLGGFLASPLGGRAADYAGRKYGARTPEGRLLLNTAATMAIMPCALLLFGWSFHYKTSLVAPLLAHFFIGVACSNQMPAIFSYLSIAKQEEAGAASAMVQSLMFVFAAVIIEISAPVSGAIGIGPWFTILAGVAALAPAVALLRIRAQLRAAPEPGKLAGGEGSAEGEQQQH